jgi:hypothetical protein
MPSDSNREELAVSLNQRWDSPQCNNRDHQQNSTKEFEMPGQLPISRQDDCC